MPCHDAECLAGAQTCPLMPADAGIQTLIYSNEDLDSRLRGNERSVLRIDYSFPRDRCTIDVVECPGTKSISTTSPPNASTISRPTTCSRV
jgi:hypothetical protein